MKASSMKSFLYALSLCVLFFSCGKKAEDDLINKAADAQVAVGAYGALYRAYPQAQNVAWTDLQGQRLWEARFAPTAVIVRSTGEIVDRGTVTALSALPASAQTYLQTTYPGSTVQVVLTGSTGLDSSPYRVIVGNATAGWHWLRMGSGGQLLADTLL